MQRRRRRGAHLRHRRIVADRLDGARQHTGQHAQHAGYRHSGPTELARIRHVEPRGIVEDTNAGVSARRMALRQRIAQREYQTDAPHYEYGQEHGEQTEHGAPGNLEAVAFAVQHVGYVDVDQDLGE